MPRPASKVAGGLEKKGFRRRQSDHTFFHLYVRDKKPVIHTKISHGAKEISDKLLGMMARQVRLSRQQFVELVDCPMNHEDYVKYLETIKAVGIDEPTRPPSGQAEQ